MKKVGALKAFITGHIPRINVHYPYTDVDFSLPGFVIWGNIPTHGMREFAINKGYPQVLNTKNNVGAVWINGELVQGKARLR